MWDYYYRYFLNFVPTNTLKIKKKNIPSFPTKKNSARQ